MRLGTRRRGRSEVMQRVLEDPNKACELPAALFLGCTLLFLARNPLTFGPVDHLVSVEDLFLGLAHVTRGF